VVLIFFKATTTIYKSKRDLLVRLPRNRPFCRVASHRASTCVRRLGLLAPAARVHAYEWAHCAQSSRMDVLLGKKASTIAILQSKSVLNRVLGLFSRVHVLSKSYILNIFLLLDVFPEYTIVCTFRSQNPFGGRAS
jgi:hypothetical protein